MELHFALCCLIAVVHGSVHNPQNLPQLYQPENIRFLDEDVYTNARDRRDRIKLDKCSFYDGRFLCKDKLRCIDLVDTCNGACDCMDCSDESDQCWIYDEHSCQTCFHTCLSTPDGPVCLCGEHDYKYSHVCKEIEECSKDNPCDQRCVRYEGVERCSCGDNYHGKPGTRGQSCISNVPYENVILYSTNNEIKLFNFTLNKAYVIKDNVKCKGLAAAQNDVYYGVAATRTGYVYKMSALTRDIDLDSVYETYSPFIFSIDVDWITGNVYFSTDKALAVCSKGSFCARIKRLTMTDSCHISLAPRSGLLFHSMRSIYHFYEHSKIMRSSMDGSDETVLVSEGLRHPMALTVDEWSQLVYWMDCDLGDIESIQFNGRNRKIWHSNPLLHIFTINKFESNVFWTEEGKNTIRSNFEMNTKIINDENTTTVKYLYAYNPLLQRTEIPNPCEDKPCNDGLCLLRPSSSRGLTFSCLCEKSKYTSKEPWCNVPFENNNWQFETASEYKIPPEKTQSNEKTNWSNVTLLIILVTAVSYSIYRRKALLRYYDRVFNWNWDREEGISLNEYEQL